MTKIGRNEPCFCGSGKKYKRCCLNKTQEDARKKYEEEQKAIEEELSALEDQKAEQGEEYEEEKNFWGTFLEQDYENQVAITAEKFEDKEWLEEYEVFDAFEAIYREACKRKDWKTFQTLIDDFEKKQPEFYKENMGAYLRYQTHLALLTGKIDKVEKFVVKMAKHVDEDIDSFFFIQDMLAFYNQPQIIVKSSKTAWTKLKKLEDAYFKEYTDNYQEDAARHIVFEALEKNSDKVKEEALLKEIKHYGDFKISWVKGILSRIKRKKKKWTLEDFALFQKDEKERNKCETNLEQLSLEFIGYLHKKQNIPYSQAEIMGKQIENYIQNRGRLFRKKIKNAEIHPDKETVNAYLKAETISLRFYRAAITLKAVFFWLDFLSSYHLIEETLYNNTLQSLDSVKTQLIELYEREICYVDLIAYLD